VIVSVLSRTLAIFVIASTSQALVLQAAAPAKPSASASSAVKPAASEPALAFDEVARRAVSARETGAASEALEWYRRGVGLRPAWEEGWWYVGSLAYSADRYAEARDAFGRFVALKPDAGAGWAMRGLSEFQLKQYDEAQRHLSQGMALGSVGNGEIRKIVYYDFALLRIRAGQFELALEPLQSLARSGPETPALLDACGLVALRDSRLPVEIPEERRELVRSAGGAVFAGLTWQSEEMRRRFDALIERYPKQPNLHYTYGMFLKEVDLDKALAAYEREVEVQPEAVLPRLELAFAHETNGRYAEALPWAEAAAKRAPGLFATRYALGRALVELGQVERGVLELEEAVRLAPESPEVRFALVRAYTAAGRQQDVERERAVFRKLVAEHKGPSSLPAFARDLTAPPEAPPKP
jgi:tetratricopeptide (TPR) repeat protein